MKSGLGLGAGGVGEVYRATDSRLKRVAVVALKGPSCGIRQRQSDFARQNESSERRKSTLAGFLHKNPPIFLLSRRGQELRSSFFSHTGVPSTTASLKRIRRLKFILLGWRAGKVEQGLLAS